MWCNTHSVTSQSQISCLCYIFFYERRKPLTSYNLKRTPSPPSDKLENSGLITRNDQQLTEAYKPANKKKKDMFYLTIGKLTKNMTTRTYKMQTRAETGVANSPGALASSFPPRRTSISLFGEVHPCLMGHYPVASPTTVLYRDSVGRRVHG